MNNRRHELEQPTLELLNAQLGTLDRDQIHELKALMKAWARLAASTKRVFTSSSFRRITRKDRVSNSVTNGVGIDCDIPMVLEKLLKRLVDEQESGNRKAKATTKEYNCVIEGWAATTKQRGAGAKEAAQRAREILLLMQRNNKRVCLPDKESFDMALMALSRVGDYRRCEHTLRWMNVLQEQFLNSNAQPTLRSYTHLMNAIANSGHEDAGEQVESIIDFCRQKGMRPNTRSYSLAIKAWSRAGRGWDGAENASRILLEMPKPPSIHCYSGVINAWANSGMQSRAARRAESILEMAVQDNSVEINEFVFNGCINAWRRSGNIAAIRRTEALMMAMKESGIAIQLTTFNSYLHILSTYGSHPGVPRKALNLLQHLEDSAAAGDQGLAPNLFTYNTVLECLAKSNSNDSAAEAVSVFQKVVNNKRIHPDNFSVNQVILAIANSDAVSTKEMPAKLMEAIRDFQQAYSSGAIRVEPDVYAYTVAINALANAGGRKAAEQATQLMSYLEERAANGERQFQPTVVTYNGLLDCWARSETGIFGARQAEEVLAKMERYAEAGNDNLWPNRISYNALLNAWAKCGSRCCAFKAEHYLEKMWDLHDNGNDEMQPDGLSYNTVINAISNSRRNSKGQQALRVLRKMDQLYRGGHKGIKPDEITYVTVLDSCAGSGDLLDDRGRAKTLDTALFVWEEFKNKAYGRPNDVAYGVLLKVCKKLLPADEHRRREIVERVFLECRGEGLVSPSVLDQLREAAPKPLYEELLGGFQAEDLPEEWTVNVHKRRSIVGSP